MHIPENLFVIFSKMCIDAGITKKEGIVRYLKYLKKIHNQQRKLLDEKSTANFKLTDKQPD